MLDIAVSIIAFIVAISVLVAVHEYGHFWVARRLGFKVLRFSIGFGRPLISWRGRDHDRVEYWISAIPLGGYVKMLDEREGPVADEDLPRAFNRRPIPARIAVLLAGPGFNFLFAILAYWALFVAGIPGSRPYIEAVVPGSIAAEAGIQSADVIESVGGRPTQTWEQAIVGMLDELLADGVIELEVSEPDGDRRRASLDVRGRESALTAPEALFDGLGIVMGPRMPALVESVEADSPADRAGLKAGDHVSAIAGEPVFHWDAWVAYIRSHPGEEVALVVERADSRLELPLTIGAADEDGTLVGRIGVTRPQTLDPAVVDRVRTEERFGLGAALLEASAKTWEMSALTVRMIGRMLTGDVSLRSASGPIMIAAYAGDYAQAGLNAFVNFLSLISISLGIMNLLPVPILDGGQIVQQLIEWAKGSPLSDRSMAFGQQLGIALLLVLMSVVFYNDITRLLMP
jgi:regulator of sigma E protease